MISSSAHLGSMGPPLPVPLYSLYRTITSARPKASNSQNPPVAAGVEPRVLRSAFVPPRLSANHGGSAQSTRWTRHCDMVEIKFTRTSAKYSGADGLVVQFSAHKTKETIEIPLEHESQEDVGFIGMGYTKRGIYVCCCRLGVTLTSCIHSHTLLSKGTIQGQRIRPHSAH